MNNIFEKICLTLILLKIFDISFCHYFATNMKIAITHLWHEMEPNTIRVREVPLKNGVQRTT